MLPKGAICLLLLVLTTITSAQSNSRFLHIKRDNYNPNRRLFTTSGTAVRNDGQATNFDPDVLNRFLEEYASKIKRTTERPNIYNDAKMGQQAQGIESDIDARNVTETFGFRDETLQLNDTNKRNKHYNGNSQNDDRNSGWVTLEAIPWSKSKISKWQANPASQRPWPSDDKPKPYEKPSYGKPWNPDYPSRPASYENNKPWQNQLTKPQWSDNSPSANKPWYSERPQQQDRPDRPGYPTIDKYEDNPNQAQKWPPERPSWNDRYPESTKPSSDIITDNGPPNFPNNNWDRPGQKPSYTHQTDSFISEHGGWHDRNDFPTNNNNNNKFNRPSNNNDDDGYYDRPHFSHYNYPSRSEIHPPSHPASGDGQWVLLSTNRGYSKTRQRSIKFDTLVNPISDSIKKKKNDEEEEHVPAVTSKRQVRLTVLPSINGTNTTTSHGGLLEVERTFKTVDQSQREYEQRKINKKSVNEKLQNDKQQQHPLPASIILNNRPIRNNLPSSSAVLAAVGAGMLPATMAMMLPVMLGKRRKRNIMEQEISYIKVPKQVFMKEMKKKM